MIYIFLLTFIFGIFLFWTYPYIDISNNKIVIWYTNWDGERKFIIIKNDNKETFQ